MSVFPAGLALGVFAGPNVTAGIRIIQAITPPDVAKITQKLEPTAVRQLITAAGQ